MATETVNVTGTIANDAVTNAKLADMAEARFKMRAAGAGTGDPIDGTPDQASTVLDLATDPFVRTSALPPSGITQVLTGLTLWVDSQNGNDGTAVRGDLTKPYLTPNAASAAASAGDNVIVFPGQYSVTSNLGKDGVNWYGYPGAHLIMTSTTANQSIFSDEGGVMSFVVDGSFILQLNTGSGASEQQWAIRTNNAASDVTVRANMILHVSGNDDADGQGAVQGNAGTLKVSASVIDSSGTGSGIAVWWGVGDMHVKADRITSNNIAIQAYATIDPPGEFFVDAQFIGSSGAAYTIQDSSTEAESRTWIKASEIVNTVGGAAFLASGGLIYVEAEKIGGGSGNPAIFLLGHTTNGGTNWVTAQKISSANKFIHAEGYADNYVNCQHYEDGGVSVGVEIDASTVNLDGGMMVLASANGIDISGGTCYAKSLTIDTSADAASNPIVKSGGTLIIAHCHLIAEGTRNSIEAPTAQSVTNVASYSARPVDADVTLIGYPISAPSAGSGDVVGPASATDHAIARYDLTTGKLIQNSGITIADGASGTLSGTNTGDQDLSGLQPLDADLTAYAGAADAAARRALIGAEAAANTQRVELSADFTTNSSSFVDVTGLAVTIPANETWFIQIDGAYQSTNAATGVGLSITRTGSPTRCNFERRIYTTATTNVMSGTVGNIDDVGPINTTVDTFNADRHWIMTGVVKASASPCVIQIRAGRGGSANNISIMAGSSIIAHRIA